MLPVLPCLTRGWIAACHIAPVLHGWLVGGVAAVEMGVQ